MHPDEQEMHINLPYVPEEEEKKAGPFSEGLGGLIDEWQKLADHWQEMYSLERDDYRRGFYDGISATYDACREEIEKLLEEAA